MTATVSIACSMQTALHWKQMRVGGMAADVCNAYIYMPYNDELCVFFCAWGGGMCMDTSVNLHVLFTYTPHYPQGSSPMWDPPGCTLHHHRRRLAADHQHSTSSWKWAVQ